MKLTQYFGWTLLVAAVAVFAANCRDAAPSFQGTRETAALDNRPSPIPDRVILTWASDPATSQAFTWRTDRSVPEGFVEIAPAEAGPRFMLEASSHAAQAEPVDSDGGLSYSHSVNVAGLRPGTLYAYRVGAGEVWSEWFQFRTASRDAEPFSFIYFGDAQNNILSLWSRTVRAAYSDAPQARFMIYAGDLVNRGDTDSYWAEWFAAAGWIHATVPSVPSVGNHEYTKNALGRRQLAPLWRNHFTLPEDTIPGLEETVYSLDYQGARIISLNSNEQIEAQAAWLEKVLHDNPNHWTIITFHHPIYSTAEGRDNTKLREAWKPLFEKYRVDLVLQGHDHTYARGSNLPLGVSRQDSDGRTVYVVSGSGPKMYRLSDDPWWERAAENTQLFQVVTVSPDRLEFRAVTVTGELYDAFELTRSEDGAKRLVDRIPDAAGERRHSNTLGGRTAD